MSHHKGQHRCICRPARVAAIQLIKMGSSRPDEKFAAHCLATRRPGQSSGPLVGEIEDYIRSTLINLETHRYVRTPILSDTIIDYLEGKGVKFATVDDCASTMLRIASEPSINGECTLIKLAGLEH